MLRDADPLRGESLPSDEERARARRTVIAASTVAQPSTSWMRTRSTAALLIAAALIAGSAAVGSMIWPGGSATVKAAAVRFEARFAETNFSPGLREARIAGSTDVVYLHPEVIVTNDDIADSTVIAGNAPSSFNIAVTFTAAGAEKMRSATAAHIGRLLAILVDGEVVMAPRLRSAIGGSAVITGDYTRAEAERIANGMRSR
jgi:preprotein translocase subunit SecD